MNDFEYKWVTLPEILKTGLIAKQYTYLCAHIDYRHCHASEHDALNKAEQMRLAEIQMHEMEILKLKQLTFKVQS